MSVAHQLPRPDMTDAEWQTRCDLAALYRVADYLGWTETIQTHMSARIPGEPNAFLINRYGEMFDEVTASSLIKMDLDGKVLGDPGRVNDAGLTIHSGVYKARPDSNCILHTHTQAGAGISVIDNGLRAISQQTLQVLDDIVYHPYGEPTTMDECEALGRTCLGGGCVVMLNHGLLTHGPTIPAALNRMYILERSCEIEMNVRMMNVVPVYIDADIVARAAPRMKQRRAGDQYGVLEWQGLVRLIDRRGADYRL